MAGQDVDSSGKDRTLAVSNPSTISVNEKQTCPSDFYGKRKLASVRDRQDPVIVRWARLASHPRKAGGQSSVIRT